MLTTDAWLLHFLSLHIDCIVFFPLSIRPARLIGAACIGILSLSLAFFHYCPRLTDNAGPHAPEEVAQILAQLRSQFPNASVVRAARWDEFVDRVLPLRHVLPLVDRELGDTWIYGIPSDPPKTALLKEAMHARAACLQSALCDVDEARFYNFSRLMIKGIEHTWAGDVKKFLNDSSYAAWSNVAFEAVRSSTDFANLEATWREQRLWALAAPLQALGAHPLAADIQRRWSALLERRVPDDPALLGYTLVAPRDWAQTWRIGAFVLAVDAVSGAIGSLTHLVTGAVWSDASHPLAQVLYQSFDEADVDAFLRQYMNCDPFLECTWALKDYGKFNVSTARPVSQIVSTTLQQLWFQPTPLGASEDAVPTGDSAPSATSLLLALSFPADAHSQCGAPASVWLRLDVGASADTQLALTLLWSNKTATRLPEATWLRFGAHANRVLIDKCGSLVDVSSADALVRNASSHLHGVWRDTVLARPDARLTVASAHAGVVSVGRPAHKLTAYPTELVTNSSALPDSDAGVAFCLHQNCTSLRVCCAPRREYHIISPIGFESRILLTCLCPFFVCALVAVWGTNYPMYFPWEASEAVTSFDFVLTFR